MHRYLFMRKITLGAMVCVSGLSLGPFQLKCPFIYKVNQGL